MLSERPPRLAVPPSTVTVAKIHDDTRNLSPDQIREAVRWSIDTLGSDEPPLTVSPSYPGGICRTTVRPPSR